MTDEFERWSLHRVSMRSNCVRRQIAASIYDRKGQLLSVGWNNPENPLERCDSDCPRSRSNVAAYSQYKDGPGRCIAVHAEDAAMRATTPEEMEGGTMYVTAKPCDDCEKLLQESGLARWEVVE